jgi:hypothetical protein
VSTERATVRLREREREREERYRDSREGLENGGSNFREFRFALWRRRRERR